jgi:DNA-binding MarR family transcriptional regulator
LILLQQEGSAAVGQIASFLGVTLPSVTATVDRLVQQGLVRREDDPNDRRRVINRLTPEGTALLERLQEGRRARLVAALAKLTPDELESLAGALAPFERALQATNNG